MSAQSISLLRPLHWKPLAHWPRAQRPAPALLSWLAHQGSLTARLQAFSQGDFSVRILRQQWALPRPEECRLLGMRRPQIALVREVVLQGKGEDWVFARSLLPQASLTGPLRHLRRQGNRPLGAFLFSQPALVRSQIQLAPIAPAHGYVPQALQAGTPWLWGRRSLFSLQARALLVSEVFLPAFCRQLAAQPR